MSVLPATAASLTMTSWHELVVLFHVPIMKPTVAFDGSSADTIAVTVPARFTMKGLVVPPFTVTLPSKTSVATTAGVLVSVGWVRSGLLLLQAETASPVARITDRNVRVMRVSILTLERRAHGEPERLGLGRL